MKDHCSGANASADILQAGEYIHVESDGYGSDSDLTLSRRGSLLGQRKAQHLHDYRALSAAPTIMSVLPPKHQPRSEPLNPSLELFRNHREAEFKNSGLFA
jgi:hypothetical protein